LSKGSINYAKLLELLLRRCFFLAYAHYIMQVVARWNPSGARKPILEEAPVYYPSEEVPC